MIIRGVDVSEFAVFDNLSVDLSKNINILIGENSVGKTILLKTLYSIVKTLDNIHSEMNNPMKGKMSMEKVKEMLSEKLVGVFRPDNGEIGRIVRRQVGRNSSFVTIKINENDEINFSFSQNMKATRDIKTIAEKVHAVYIPPKEIISATENFSSLYEQYYIAFEETYHDLSKLLLKPLKRGPNTKEQEKILKIFEKTIEGKVVQKENKFYLKTQGIGQIEMGLVAEGHRKLATILQLISNGSLGSDTVLFWDEPESNINPKVIPCVVEAIVELAKMGVQVFIATHSYFIQKEFSLYSEYDSKKDKMDIRFLSLYKEDDLIKVETASNINDLEHNVVMEEFENLYNKGVEKAYAD